MRSAALLLSLLMAPVLYAQEVQVQKQHSLKKWGVPAGNYSGITHIQDDRYALISDKQEADGWTEVSIRFLPSGEIEEVQFNGLNQNKQREKFILLCLLNVKVFYAENYSQLKILQQ